MSKLKPIDDMQRFVDEDPARRERIESRKQAMRQGAALARLRRAHGLTQHSVAESLSVSQANVSRIEHGADVYLSTLDSYIAALGGKLVLSADFPEGHSYVFDASGTVTEGAPANPPAAAGFLVGHVTYVAPEKLTLDVPGELKLEGSIHVGEKMFVVDTSREIGFKSSFGKVTKAVFEGVDSEDRLIIREAEAET